MKENLSQNRLRKTYEIYKRNYQKGFKGAFGLQNSKYYTKQYKKEQHNARENNTKQIFMPLNNFLFYMIFGGRNAILVF